MGRLFEAPPKPAILDYKAEHPVVIWYRPTDLDGLFGWQEWTGKKKGKKASQLTDDDKKQILTGIGLVVRIDYGDDSEDDPDNIRDTLTQDWTLAIEAWKAITEGRVSDVERGFSE